MIMVEEIPVDFEMSINPIIRTSKGIEKLLKITDICVSVSNKDIVSIDINPWKIKGLRKGKSMVKIEGTSEIGNFEYVFTVIVV